MTAYYNENDPKAAAWLRELMGADVIVRGEVDERDIRDITPADLVGFTQCHFFAGIGGWPFALRLAGWPDERQVWTGSCPCQPFSSAGKGAGSTDERHLWPAFFHLIEHANPPVLFGEQVASPAGLIWVRAVQTDLEGSGYSVGIADLPAASVGAPHIRQRLFWLAESVGQRRERIRLHLQPRQTRFNQSEVGRNGEVGICVGDAGRAGLSQRVSDGCVQREAVGTLPRKAALGPGDLVDVDLTASGGFERLGDQPTHLQSVSANPQSDFLAHADLILGGQGGEESRGRDRRGDEESRSGSGSGEMSCELGHTGCDGARQHAGELSGDEGQHEKRPAQRDHTSIAAGAAGFWDDCDWLPCRDGKSRPVEPGTFPLAHGVPGRVGLLRGYGNAIVPQVAAEFIGAYLDTLGD